jgi:hypothetical protein
MTKFEIRMNVPNPNDQMTKREDHAITDAVFRHWSI